MGTFIFGRTCWAVSVYSHFFCTFVLDYSGRMGLWRRAAVRWKEEVESFTTCPVPSHNSQTSRSSLRRRAAPRLAVLRSAIIPWWHYYRESLSKSQIFDPPPLIYLGNAYSSVNRLKNKKSRRRAPSKRTPRGLRVMGRDRAFRKVHDFYFQTRCRSLSDSL